MAKKRFLIISASAGNGHVMAARALERTLIQQYGDTIEVKNVDALKFSTPLVRRMYAKGYINLVNKMPKMLGWMYDAMDTPWKGHRRRLAWHRANCKPLLDLMLDYKPDVVISTHFVGSELVSYLQCTHQLDATNAVVVTDFDAHAMWLCHHYDQFFVALPSTRAYLSSQKIGLEAERIHVTGIPIDPVFAVHKDKAAMRQKYGLHPHLPAILLSAGGFGVGPMEEILQELTQLKNPVQVLALCGKNEELKKKLEDRASELPASLKLVAIGYTDKMDEYMSASDILLGKPGGLTTSEALAKGLAFVIVNPIPGQEERNSHHLLEKGVAIRCVDMPALAFRIDELLSNPGQIARMQENALHMGRPLAAAQIIDILEATPPGHSGAHYDKHRCRKCRK